MFVGRLGSLHERDVAPENLSVSPGVVCLGGLFHLVPALVFLVVMLLVTGCNDLWR